MPVPSALPLSPPTATPPAPPFTGARCWSRCRGSGRVTPAASLRHVGELGVVCSRWPRPGPGPGSGSGSSSRLKLLVDAGQEGLGTLNGLPHGVTPWRRSGVSGQGCVPSSRRPARCPAANNVAACDGPCEWGRTQVRHVRAVPGFAAHPHGAVEGFARYRATDVNRTVFRSPCPPHRSMRVATRRRQPDVVRRGYRPGHHVHRRGGVPPRRHRLRSLPLGGSRGRGALRGLPGRGRPPSSWGRRLQRRDCPTLATSCAT